MSSFISKFFYFFIYLFILSTSHLSAQYTGGRDDGYAMATWSSTNTTSNELVKVFPTILTQTTSPQFNILVESRDDLHFQLVAINGQILADDMITTFNPSTMQQLFQTLSVGAYLLRFDYKGEQQVIKIVVV